MIFTRKEMQLSNKQPNMAACFLRNTVLHHENQSGGVSDQITFQ